MDAVDKQDDGGSDLGELPLWNLDDLYPGRESQAFAEDLKNVTIAIKDFAAQYRGEIESLVSGPDGGEGLARAIRSYEAIDDTLGRLISYAGLSYNADMSDDAVVKFYGDTQERITELATQLLFFTLEINKLEDPLLAAALQTPALAYYSPWLRDVRAERPYQLEDRLEELLHEKAISGRNAWNRLFEETEAAMRFEVDGKALTIEPTLHMLTDPDREVRRKGSDALAKTFTAHLKTFTLITNTLAKDKEIEDRWRGFEDMVDSRHLANRVEGEVVEALVAAVQASYPTLAHRYYALKARWLGLDKLAHYDRNAPLPEEDDRTISWTEARQTVLDAYAGFTPALADLGTLFFEKGWIDAPVRDGKSPGAFSHPTVPSAHPYILLNYQGRTRDVMVLAHELGHGVHQVLAADQGALMAQTPLTLAETASVFGEMLTFQALLAKTEDPVQRKVLLASKVEDMLNTVVRQIAFYDFERRIHGARRTGELTPDAIGDIWMAVQSESLGPALDLGPGYETFWCYIPHFIHTPFYVYAYAFGDCLVNALYAVYENAHEGFAERYLDMLRAGGTLRHHELLAPFGLDASDPTFWQKGLGLIARFVDELEALDGGGI